MENKINIADLLKDCPSGMELDCTMYEDVYFDYVDEKNIIHCYIQRENYKTSIPFNSCGTITGDPKSKCVIFPKGKTTWDKFQRPFTDGDIAISKSGDWICIVKSYTNCYNVYNVYKVYVAFDNRRKYLNTFNNTQLKLSRLATEEEKEKLFSVLKDNDYRWNAETKTLEKVIVPKFKVGDVIQADDGYKIRITEVNTDDALYGYELLIAKGIGSIAFSEQDYWELVQSKFDITTLKPFDKVLVRDENDQKWMCDIFSYYDDKNIKWPFWGVGRSNSKQCIPYEGNEHLLGTTNDCDEYYKNWNI